ncbi:clathrin interactor 1-like [Tropilaelaps mercedesae]|uniref:Clathrin interactor 1-like n=1 Tax=Tropilaelaps mercedesae TaxID=418985 RepID=A0A1V9XKE8_9ACAR|nr:clathrin interactor 1-like [Tropilaelaps mercedesae]
MTCFNILDLRLEAIVVDMCSPLVKCLVEQGRCVSEDGVDRQLAPSFQLLRFESANGLCERETAGWTNVLYNFSELEAKVREATNDEPWGPHSSLMQEISQATFSYESFPEVMGMLWRRLLEDNKRVWRRVYKAMLNIFSIHHPFPVCVFPLWPSVRAADTDDTGAGLLLLDYLVKNGSERVVTSAREHIYDLRSLENYTFVDELGKDQGVNVRNRVKDLIEVIQDDDRLRAERKKAKKSKDKYIGLSGEAIGFASRRTGDFADFPSDRRSHQRRGSFGDSNDEDSDRDTKRGYRDSPSPPRKEDRPDRADRSIDESRMSPPKGLGAPTNLQQNLDRQTKKSMPSKMVDLGAAANFTGDAKSQISGVAATQSASSDLLSDLGFGGSPSGGTTAPTANGDFADFSQFPGTALASPPSASAATTAEDDFADFASFNSATTSSSGKTSLPVSGLAAATPANVSSSTTSLPADLFGGQVMTSPVMGSISMGASPMVGMNLVGASPMGPASPTMFAPTSPLMAASTLSPTTSMLTPAPLIPTSVAHPGAAGGGGGDGDKKDCPGSGPANVGSTWNGLNISVDNLLGPKQQEKRPTMNQLAQSVQTMSLGMPLGSQSVLGTAPHTNSNNTQLNNNHQHSHSNNNNNNNNNNALSGFDLLS